jgi:hypothetical protein
VQFLNLFEKEVETWECMKTKYPKTKLVTIVGKNFNCKEVQNERRFKMIYNNFDIELWIANLYA